jgi:hypothetical protein
MAIDLRGPVHLIHVDLRRWPYMPGGQKVDFDRQTAMYQICIKTADTSPYQRVPPRPAINIFALLSGMV